MLILSPTDNPYTYVQSGSSNSKLMNLIRLKNTPTFSIAATIVARDCTLAGKILIIYKFLKYSFAFFVIR